MTAKFVPTEEHRRTVKAMTAFGVPQDQICVILDISEPTLRKHFKREIAVAMTEANAKVGESLFKMATNGNVAAAIFWSKVRMGWSEKVQLEHSGMLQIETIRRVIVDPKPSGA